jgi:hypothetical protein
VNIGFDFRRGPAFLPDALEYFAARVNTIWGKEHDPATGVHTNITADTIMASSIRATDIQVTGSLTAPKATFGDLVIAGTTPTLVFNDTDASPNSRAWVVEVYNGPFVVSTATDTQVSQQAAIWIDRTELTPSRIVLNADTVVVGFTPNQIFYPAGNAYFKPGTTGRAAIGIWAGVEGIGELLYYNNQGAWNGVILQNPAYGRFSVQVASSVFTLETGYVYPAGHLTEQLGRSGNQWQYIWAGWHTAPINYGFIFDNNTSVGYSYDGSYLRLMMGGGAFVLDWYGDVYATGSMLPWTDNYTRSGNSTHRWVDVWAVNGTIQTSDLRLKMVEGETPLGLGFIKALRPVVYRWKDRPEQIRHGLVAQDLASVLDRLNVAFSGLHVPETEEEYYALNYSEFIAPLVKAIQELDSKLEQLQARVAA